MKVIVFDLKNTLVKDDKTWVEGAKEAYELAVKSADQTAIYSMNEPWTYIVLTTWSKFFQDSSKVLLVSKKIRQDLMEYKKPGNEVLVVGDSVTEELATAKALGFQYLQVDGVLEAEKIADFLTVRALK